MNKLSMKQLLILVLVVDILLCGAFILTKVLKKEEPAAGQISASNIQRICELATLECYYHNVSDWSQPGYGLFGYGEKKVWIEYDGIVRVGINAGRIRISEPDQDLVVTVTIPAAVILDKDLDESTIREIASDRTVLFFTDQVNTDDRRKALAAAQDHMQETASKNEMILGEAQERAKMIIERNIIAIGEASGKKYTVRFVEDSARQSSAPATEETP